MLPNKLCRVRRFGLLLAISQTQDIRDDTVGIIIFDHKVWHRTVRGVQCGSECSGCHSWRFAILANVGAFSFVELPFSFTIR